MQVVTELKNRGVEQIYLAELCKNWIFNLFVPILVQAKGCVERANKTLQDRLVKELRLRNISIIEAANNYLDQFVKEHDDRFSKAPLSDQNIHRELSAHMFLDNILCYKTLRTVSCNLTFQHNRQLFLLEDNPETRGLSKKQVSLYVQIKT